MRGIWCFEKVQCEATESTDWDLLKQFDSVDESLKEISVTFKGTIFDNKEILAAISDQLQRLSAGFIHSLQMHYALN